MKIIKKILSIALCLALVMSYVPMVNITVSATASDLTVTIDTGASVTLKDADGDGYYEISTADDLYAFAALAEGKNHQNIELTNNIIVNDVTFTYTNNTLNVTDKEGNAVDVSTLRLWKPIGGDHNSVNGYNKTINGNGFCISGIYCTVTSGYSGLFYRDGNAGTSDSADIENLGVVNSFFSGNSNTGVFLGMAYRGTTIRNCYSDAIVVGDQWTGGFVGYSNGNNELTISNSYYFGTLKNKFTGGVFVSEGTWKQSINNCYYLDGCATFVNNDGAIAVTAEQLASGELAYKLGSAWGQNIDNGLEYQEYPVPGGAVVYHGYISCADDAAIVYTNDSTASETKPGHSSDIIYTVNKTDNTKHDGACSRCGKLVIIEGDHVPENEENKATCKTAVYCHLCEHCIEQINPDNHEVEDTYYKLIDDNTHALYHSCCDAFIESGEHTPSNAPTCTDRSICSACGKSYGDVDEDAHTYIYTANDGAINENCELCDHSASINLVLPEAPVYNENEHVASYAGDYTNPNVNILIQYLQSNEDSETGYEILESAPVDAGTYIVRLSVGEIYADSIMTIEPKEITLMGAEVKNKDYDGTPYVEIDPRYGGFEVDGVSIYDSIKILCTSAELESANAGRYDMVTVKGLTIEGDKAHNYTVVSEATIPVYNIWGNSESSVTVWEKSVVIDLLDQEAGSLDAIDQNKWEIGEYSGLLEGHRIESVKLVAEMNEGSTKYGTISAEEGSVKIVDADGNDVTANYGISTYSATLTVTCPDHDEFEHGFCKNCGGYESAVLNDNATPDDTYDDYYEIENAGQLFWFAEYIVNVSNEADAKLTADITIPEGKEWTPIYNLYGTFDGNYKTISGLQVSESDSAYVGFLGYIGYYANVRNLHITNSSFIDADATYVGAIVGYHGGGEITNCYTDATVKVESNGVCGALVGYTSYTTMKNCYAHGALAGNGHYGTFENCYYIGEDDGIDGTTAVTAEQFTSGEVAYLLQQGNTDQVWGQDSNQAGATPMFTSNELYKVVTVGETGNYSVANVGDTNGDGTVDVTDYQALVNKALADDHEQIETASYDDIVKYDLDGDGYLDVIDAYLLHLFINGFTTVDVYAVGDYDLNGMAFEEADIKAIKHAIENPEKLATYKKYASDINGDGKLDENDLTVLTAKYGEVTGTECADNVKVYYRWGNSYTTCTATAICTICDKHVAKETVNSVLNADGSYTATFTNTLLGTKTYKKTTT